MAKRRKRLQVMEFCEGSESRQVSGGFRNRRGSMVCFYIVAQVSLNGKQCLQLWAGRWHAIGHRKERLLGLAPNPVRIFGRLQHHRCPVSCVRTHAPCFHNLMLLFILYPLMRAPIRRSMFHVIMKTKNVPAYDDTISVKARPYGILHRAVSSRTL